MCTDLISETDVWTGTLNEVFFRTQKTKFCFYTRLITTIIHEFCSTNVVRVFKLRVFISSVDKSCLRGVGGNWQKVGSASEFLRGSSQISFFNILESRFRFLCARKIAQN